MKLLECFSGTGSIGRAFRALGWEVISLDLDPKSGADIIADVCEWQPPEGLVIDALWMSPPCTEFSYALTSRPRRLEEGLRPARRCLELIAHFKRTNPNLVWFIENPDAHLPKQEIFRDLPHHIVTYCKYNTLANPTHPYRKRTWIATNCKWNPRPCCCKASPCEFLAEGRHPDCAQRGPVRCKEGLRGRAMTQGQLYSMPAALCDEIALVATQSNGRSE